jgi:NifU-like protein involved in Fe-S cluster formation
MRTIAVISLILTLAGCGVETASTAATAAAVKNKEIEEGKKTEDQARKQIGDAMDRMQQKSRQGEER